MTLIHYKKIDTIHHFKFEVSTRNAVDEYLNIFNRLFAQHIETLGVDIPFCFVLDTSACGIFPIAYIKNNVLATQNQYDVVPPQYIAYVTDDQSDNILWT